MSKNLQMSNSDRAIANLMYARDCVYQGKLLRASKALTTAISLLARQDQRAIDDEVIRLLNGGAND
jgi:hypothetical protein